MIAIGSKAEVAAHRARLRAEMRTRNGHMLALEANMSSQEELTEFLGLIFKPFGYVRGATGGRVHILAGYFFAPCHTHPLLVRPQCVHSVELGFGALHTRGVLIPAPPTEAILVRGCISDLGDGPSDSKRSSTNLVVPCAAEM